MCVCVCVGCQFVVFSTQIVYLVVTGGKQVNNDDGDDDGDGDGDGDGSYAGGIDDSDLDSDDEFDVDSDDNNYDLQSSSKKKSSGRKEPKSQSKPKSDKTAGPNKREKLTHSKASPAVRVEVCVVCPCSWSFLA